MIILYCSESYLQKLGPSRFTVTEEHEIPKSYKDTTSLKQGEGYVNANLIPLQRAMDSRELIKVHLFKTVGFEVKNGC